MSNYRGKKQFNKSETLKIRVSKEWSDTLDTVASRSFFLKNKNRSYMIRYLVMKGLLNYCDPSDIEAVQNQIEKTI